MDLCRRRLPQIIKQLSYLLIFQMAVPAPTTAPAIKTHHCLSQTYHDTAFWRVSTTGKCAICPVWRTVEFSLSRQKRLQMTWVFPPEPVLARNANERAAITHKAMASGCCQKKRSALLPMWCLPLPVSHKADNAPQATTSFNICTAKIPSSSLLSSAFK